MDGESNYESDISESWSLIDVNLNEESVSVTNTQPKLEETHLPDTKDVNLKKLNNIELEDFVRQCRESVTDHSGCCHSDSDSSIENHEVLKGDESDGCSEQDKNDSGDAESIEILDLDGNHMDSEAERLDISMINGQEQKSSAHQSDDDESWVGNVDNKIRSTSLTVIQRKKNLVKHSESPIGIVNSDLVSKGKSNFNSQSNDEKNLKVQLGSTNSLPVYKHYRNNVVNTFLSLSMGIVFAGVACIAVGHFLGVHDAAETAMELVETLKKLQMENVALQSRWSQLNRAVLKQNINSKLELPPTKPRGTVSCEERPNYGPARTKTTNVNQAALPEIQSSLKSIQWLTKLENMINEKIENEGNEINCSGIGKYIQNQLNLLNDKKVEGFRLLEDSDKKISKLLRKIIERLSSSQENIEKLYNRLILLKDKMNHKLFPDNVPRRMPVTENDLNSMQSYTNGENPSEENFKSNQVFKFPQPEEFYKMKNNSILTEKQTSNNNNDGDDNNKTVKEKNERKLNKEENNRRKRGKKWRREKSKDAEKKLQKKLKHGVKASKKFTVKKYKTNEASQLKYTFGRFNETKEVDKKFSKGKDEEKAKRKARKIKKPKILRAVSSKQNKRNYLKKNGFTRICSGYECFNLTGYWVFKYASGREEFRRYQTLSDWQFERAKGRKEQRSEEDVGSWQFRRALARENGRNDHRLRPDPNRKNYDSEDFYHETFS